MIKFGKIKNVVLHFVGNKFNGEGVKISNECLNFAPVKKDLAALVSSAFDMKELYSFKNIKASENEIFSAQVRKSVDSPPGMLTEDHHHTVHEERQVCYSSHLRPKSLHL